MSIASFSMLSVTSPLEPVGTMSPVQSEFGIVCDVRQRNLDPPCRLSDCVSFCPSLSPGSLWSVFGQTLELSCTMKLPQPDTGATL